MRIPLVLITALALPAIGCSASTSSQNIRTPGLVALIDVTSTGGGQAVVETRIVVGGANSNTYVILEAGDGLSAEADGDKRAMQAVGTGHYEAKFSGVDAETAFTVSLERSVDDPAPNSTGVLPAPFEITSKLGTRPIPRGTGVKVTWSPSGDSSDVGIEIDGDCIHDKRFSVGGDPGKFTIPGKDVRAWKSKRADNCNVDVTVTRTRSGTTDPALDSDSRFLLHQIRSTRFVSGPGPDDKK